MKIVPRVSLTGIRRSSITIPIRIENKCRNSLEKYKIVYVGMHQEAEAAYVQGQRDRFGRSAQAGTLQLEDPQD
jgi:hypothetical protein